LDLKWFFNKLVQRRRRILPPCRRIHLQQKMALLDRENKVVLGLLLSVATPNKGTAYGMSLYTTNGGAKRTKVQANYAFIMVFADLMDLPNCFVEILHQVHC